MVYSHQKRRSFALLALVVFALTLVFAACSTSTKFTPNDFTPQATSVESNGGVALRVCAADGNWIYYVNGYASTATATNAYDTGIRTGQIMRIKESDLNDIVDIYYAEDSDTTYADAIYEKAQIVVPYFFYSGNTASALTDGIFVFGNRLYYKTPNYNLDKDGVAKTSELLVNSCALNGSDTKTHLILDVISTAVVLSEVSGKVYAVYTKSATVKNDKDEDETFTYVYSADLSGEKVSASIVSTEKQSVSTFTYDTVGNTFFWLDKATNIVSYVGGGEAKALTTAADGTKLKYTLVAAQNKIAFYTKTATLDSVDGIYSVDSTAATPTEQVVYATSTQLTGTAGASITYFGGQNALIVTANLNPKQSISTYDLFILKADGSKTFLLEQDTNTSEITLIGVGGDGNTLFYTKGGVYYAINLDTLVHVEDGLTSSTPYASIWATYDVCGDYVFMFDSNGIITATCEHKEEKDTYISIEITYAEPEEDDE